MSLVNFTNLDFDQIRNSIKDYLRSNSDFTDYDFEGSNMSVIIDILAYNTYIASFNANMVSNEVFIDSATLRENVVSLARNIGYVPRSRKCSVANISFFVDTTGFTYAPVSLTLKAGTVCVSGASFGGENYTFSIIDDITVPVQSSGLAFFDNIDVYEGSLIINNFTVDNFNPNQRFLLDNAGIDTTRISVLVRTSQTDPVSRKYRISDSLFEIDGESAVFFIQEVEDERYELLFGDGIFGKKLEYNNFIEVSYLVCSGPLANNISEFNFSGRIYDNNGRVITDGISLLTTNQKSYGGTDIESVSSIKKYSTKIYSAQNRAVTASDYEAIVPKLYPETESISVFGGEDLSPPKYGKVFISIKPFNGNYLSNLLKDNIKKSLKPYSVAGIVPEIVDLKYLFIEADIKAYYNNNLSPSVDFVRSTLISNINSYADSSELNKFGARFRYSKFLKIIDDSHESITSNVTNIIIRRDMSAKINSFAEYEICFGNRFHIKNINGYNIKSSGFKVPGVVETVYLGDAPNSNQETGELFLFTLSSATQPVIVQRNVGTVDYLKGEILLSPINILSTSIEKDFPIIEISCSPYSNDVIGLQDLFIQLDSNKINVDMVSDRIISGADVSGTTYIVSSSYSNGTLVR